MTLERDALRSRVEQLERERVRCGSTESQAGEAELRQQLVALAKENHELHVVLRNSDAEGALLRQEKKFSRQLDKCRVYARSLENLLEEERKVR